jgi:hypothetical protein
MAGFGISGVESSGSVTTVLVYHNNDDRIHNFTLMYEP